MSERPTILLIEDEPNLLNSLAFILESEGFDVVRARTGEEGIAVAARRPPDLVLLDLMLPGMDGFEVAGALRHLREADRSRIVVLTGSDLEEHMIRALESFADDYVVKPVRPRVLIARLKLVLGRPSGRIVREPRLVIGALSIDPPSFEARINGEIVPLTRTEFHILLALARNVDTAMSRSSIIDAVHGADHAISERSIDFQIHGLRAKLGAEGERLVTVRGVGFKLKSA
ncbi:MAG: response regulator transcription factor [Deltaproteobacteria bacterium]|nr:response regulator transcription factor [Deltaproteobacteria bacterium]